MFKKIVLILVSLLVLIGCSKSKEKDESLREYNKGDFIIDGDLNISIVEASVVDRIDSVLGNEVTETDKEVSYMDLVIEVSSENKSVSVKDLGWKLLVDDKDVEVNYSKEMNYKDITNLEKEDETPLFTEDNPLTTLHLYTKIPKNKSISDIKVKFNDEITYNVNLPFENRIVIDYEMESVVTEENFDFKLVSIEALEEIWILENGNQKKIKPESNEQMIVSFELEVENTTQEVIQLKDIFDVGGNGMDIISSFRWLKETEGSSSFKEITELQAKEKQTVHYVGVISSTYDKADTLARLNNHLIKLIEK